MLKVRLIGVVVVKGGIAVQSIGFNTYLPIGKPTIAVEYLNNWGIDEIILVDIDATPEGRCIDPELVRACSKYVQVPLAIGGGIKSVDDIRMIIQAGADKVVINSAAHQNPQLISEGARLFGNQCIVVAIDAKKEADAYVGYTHSGSNSLNLSIQDLAQKAHDKGAGEIFLNSIDRDGSKKGYDLDLLKNAVEAVDIPVVICGGVNHPQDFHQALEFNVSGVAAANFFHYSEQSVITAKQYLQKHNDQFRLDSYATYANFDFDNQGRAAKLDDDYLDKLRFEYIPEEVI